MNITLNTTLTSNSPCITIGTSGITLNCAGYSVATGAGGSPPSGNDGAAILLDVVTHVTVENCVVGPSSGGYGIRIQGAGPSVPEFNLLMNNTSDNNSFSSLTGGGFGIDLDGGANNTLTHNTSMNNGQAGINLSPGSVNNTIYDNRFVNPLPANNAVGSGKNQWNIAKTPGANIIGGPYLAGNYWGNYNGTDPDNDGIGDNQLPYTNGGRISPGDYLPLAYPTPPSCGSTITVNATLTTNLGPCSGNGLNIGASGITLDCKGHSITGSTAAKNSFASGVFLHPYSNVVVKGCLVQDFYYGIDLGGGAGNAGSHNTVGFANYIRVVDYYNTVENNTYGIWGDGGTYNIISGNHAFNNKCGICVSDNNDTLAQNNASSNSARGIGIGPDSLGFGGNNNTVIYNNANSNGGNPNTYQSGITIQGHHNTVENNYALTNTFAGVILVYGGNNTLRSNIISFNHVGMNITSSSNNLIYNNYFFNTVNANDTNNDLNYWNIPKTATTTSIIGGPYLGGNYWSDYTGTDPDGDWIGDNMLPYHTQILHGGDSLPLVFGSSSVGGTILPANRLVGLTPSIILGMSILALLVLEFVLVTRRRNRLPRRRPDGPQ